ncbi:hypothetical protein [Frigoribacterium sp. RIT-PI-h]|uniref:hypothetical protein n=1 Tax=Frigoribacterium sp. RIT-PI-h TaxID=1690245 RepID=UPI0006B8C1D6|nr:hypothetical protein [Frigoribacterium sp. RIT-PI-h]KPG81417.1 hypothetical protein AEQ27_11130 [Frigoribacterium sp. RIT-PI-h]
MGTFVLRLAAIAACGLAATWLATGAEQICPAIYPAPESCRAGARIAPATTWTVILTALSALTIVLDALRNERAVRVVAVTLLGLSCTVAPLWTLFASGFAADERVLLIALLILLVVTMTGVTSRALRKGRWERV